MYDAEVDATCISSQQIVSTTPSREQVFSLRKRHINSWLNITLCFEIAVRYTA